MSLSKRETSRFCSQLKMMLASGMPLLEALATIRMVSHKKFDRRLTLLIDMISEGHSLSEAAVGFLPALAIGSLQAAERAGNLEETLENLSKYYENKADLEEKFLGALVYPCFVLTLSLLSVLVLIFFVLPGLKGLFSDLGTELPFFTNVILGFSDFLSRFWLVFVGVPVATVWFLKRRTSENFVLQMPLLGKLIRQELIIQGFGTLGALLNGGTPILEALAITADASRSAIFRKIVLRAREGVENGEKLSDELQKCSFFPKETIQMLRVGESSGRLAEMLLNIANFQAKEREGALKRFTTLLEPAMTLSVGLVVGFIVLAMFLPMINMISKLQ